MEHGQEPETGLDADSPAEGSTSREGAGPRAGLGAQWLPPPPAGVLSYLNHMGVRSKRSLSFEMQAMYRQWAVRQSSLRNEYGRQLGADL